MTDNCEFKKKWTLTQVFLLLLSYPGSFSRGNFALGAPEKLTQEQVLEELGVKIETKGKK